MQPSHGIPFQCSELSPSYAYDSVTAIIPTKTLQVCKLVEFPFRIQAYHHHIVMTDYCYHHQMNLQVQIYYNIHKHKRQGEHRLDLFDSPFSSPLSFPSP